MWAELRLDDLVKIDAAGLDLRADRLIDSAGRPMFDFVPQFKQEFEVCDHAFRQRALRVLQAVSKPPIPFCAAFKRRNLFHSINVFVIPIVNTKPPEMGMVQVGPSNDGCDNEKLRAEIEARAVKGVDGGDHRLPGFD